MSCKESAWIDFKKINKSTKIHLVAWRSLIIQPGAPVYSVKFYDVNDAINFILSSFKLIFDVSGTLQSIESNY